VAGVIALLAWVFLGLAASSVAGREGLDPEERFGDKGRNAVSGLLGFGLGGMSASFAGWSTGLAIVGAVMGALVAILVGRYLGVEGEASGDGA
jgi:hypothetical protein